MWIDAAREVVEHRGFVLVDGDGWRSPTEADWQAIDAYNEVAEMTESSVLRSSDPEPPDGVILDLFTASMLVQIHDALAPENRARFAALPLTRAVTVGWKLVDRARI